MTKLTMYDLWYIYVCMFSVFRFQSIVYFKITIEICIDNQVAFGILRILKMEIITFGNYWVVTKDKLQAIDDFSY